MNIALITGSKIPARTANSIQTMKMAQAMLTLGHTVRVYIPGQTPDIPWDEIAQHYGIQAKIDIRWLPANPRMRSYDFGFRSVRQAIRRDADLIYTRLPQAAAYASWRAFPTIYEIHDMPSGRFGPRLLRVFLHGRGAVRLVSITSALADDINMIYRMPNKTGFRMTAPDGVDLDRYNDLPAPRKARQSLGLPDKFTAGYTGHLYPGRGIALVLRVAGRLPEFSFLIAGGEHKDIARLKSRVAAKGLDNIAVLGFISNEELPLYQAACDALLMPYQARVAASSGGDISRYLSPMKMFEYLACGRAILASDLPVLQEVLVQEENALIVPAASEDAWVQALRKLNADPDYKSRLGNRAREAANKYTWKARAERVLGDIAP